MPDRQSDTMMKILELVDKAMGILFGSRFGLLAATLKEKRPPPIIGVDPGG
jgi:hypothetical protein